jgi:hypothetical protein
MKTSDTQTLRRVPKGAGRQRVQVAFKSDVLRKLMLDARREMRTMSAMAALIITRYYQGELDGTPDSPSASVGETP